MIDERAFTVDADPDGQRLPIKLDSTSNGEFAPVPLDESQRAANALAAQWAESFARKLNRSRRSFLVSACGAASTLLAFNAAHARAGRAGGFFEVSKEAALEPQLAAAELGKQEFIFDVQGHFVNSAGAWTRSLPPGARPLAEMLMLHGRVNPNQKGDVEDMERLAKLGVVAFKTYTQWGPEARASG